MCVCVCVCVCVCILKFNNKMYSLKLHQCTETENFTRDLIIINNLNTTISVIGRYPLIVSDISVRL